VVTKATSLLQARCRTELEFIEFWIAEKFCQVPKKNMSEKNTWEFFWEYSSLSDPWWSMMIHVYWVRVCCSQVWKWCYSVSWSAGLVAGEPRDLQNRRAAFGWGTRWVRDLRGVWRMATWG
jgi:hypothetical protein